ncbi:hypothetical protein A2533_02270 [Candidatus Falkowbacteria bacterium RIFOXYD2_FULL_35_9]|uniref:Uncharacterized protein n=1 Tax=Candidatus Falkowbacteria bacterium RIFOXYC2_FULL_36_12 TaxID=1798002 RepID=A0A1F5T0G1_9BACT|nr:MAG: hypothetical protein A2478_02770 [Candidatus Falkowbacteria bacterium RIFOXYC2_FULL_36_12]OGF33219.1 MAG: hypothetical protein A2223_01420 [Candidatus Falkowbacteria bacterium RIFOXYA2_FULL_35_8]OGF48330.1 MAG: hypothetical protein A2533_02270 [Candidatus Falkowbacteria bacterium RIFOXYD2_FULL_35_9]
MKKIKFKKNELINIVLLSAMGLILVFFIVYNVNSLRSSQLIVSQMNMVKQFFVDAREKAIWGEKLEGAGESPAAYGVYYDVARNELVMCADLAGDLDCESSEVVDKLQLQENFEISDFKVVNFLRFHTVNGACVDLDCQLDGETSVLTLESKQNNNIKKQLILNQTDLEIKIQ